MNAKYSNQILEWIPYNRFEKIQFVDKGGFGTIYKAIWLNGSIKYWSSNKDKWIRTYKKIVVLKSFDKSSNLNEEFLNEV